MGATAVATCRCNAHREAKSAVREGVAVQPGLKRLRGQKLRSEADEEMRREGSTDKKAARCEDVGKKNVLASTGPAKPPTS